MEENNVVKENEELETEMVPAEETYDESNGGSTLNGVAIGVAGTLGAQWRYKKALKPRLTRLRSWPRRRARRIPATTLLRSNPSKL